MSDLVRGLRVGHWTDPVGLTGCTVLLFDEPAMASGDVRGGAPGSTDTALLDPWRTVQRIDAVLLTGQVYQQQARRGLPGREQAVGVRQQAVARKRIDLLSLS